MKNPLTCDIKRRIYMSYVPCQRCPESRTAQSGSHSTAGARGSARGRRTARPVLFHLQAPSLSLPRTGTAAQTPSPGRRRQSIFHRQTLAQSGGQASRLRRFHRIDLERDRQPCLVGGTSSRGRTWLTGHQVDNEPCGWNINLTDCCQRNWCRLMNCSCPPKTSQPRLLPHAPAAIRRF